MSAEGGFAVQRQGADDCLSECETRNGQDASVVLFGRRQFFMLPRMGLVVIWHFYQISIAARGWQEAKTRCRQ
jgi:hypothetical protein